MTGLSQTRASRNSIFKLNVVWDSPKVYGPVLTESKSF